MKYDVELNSRSVLLELGHAACTVIAGAYRSERSIEPVK